MCGRFAQYSSRDDYFDSLGLTPDEIIFDPEPLGRFNVAPGTTAKRTERFATPRSGLLGLWTGVVG